MQLNTKARRSVTKQNCFSEKMFLSISFLLFTSIGSFAEIPLDAKDSGLYQYVAPKLTTFLMRQSVACNEATKKAFWKTAKEGKFKRAVLGLTFTRPKGWKYRIPPFEEAKKQIDNFFGTSDGVETYPSMLYAVVVGEENIYWAGQAPLLSKIGDYIRATYKVPVYQWLSEPLPPMLRIYNKDFNADGWVFDAYSVPNDRFYAHLQKFILTGKPVVPVLWGAEIGFSNYFKDMSAEDFIRHIKPRMEYCRSLNLPIILFAVVSKPYGNVSRWLTSKKKTIAPLRDFFLDYFEKMKTAPLPSVNVPIPTNTLKADSTGTGQFKMTMNFSVPDECLASPISNWQLTREGLLKLRVSADTISKIDWNFVGATKPLSSIKLKLTYSLTAGDGTVTFSYKVKNRENTFKLTASQTTLDVTIPNCDGFSLRLEAKPGAAGKFLLKGLAIKCKAPFEMQPIVLKQLKVKGNYVKGVYVFGDKFIDPSTFKLSSYNFKESNTTVVNRNGFWIYALEKGPNKVEAIQKVEVPPKTKTIKISGGCIVMNYYGGKFAIGISTNGKTVLAEKHNDPKHNQQNIVLDYTSSDYFPKYIYIHWRGRFERGLGVRKNKIFTRLYKYGIRGIKEE